MAAAPSPAGRIGRLAMCCGLLCAILRVTSLETAFAEQAPPPRHAVAHALPLREVRWTGGFWKQRADACRNRMIPGMWELMKGVHHKPFFEHFRIAAGMAEGDYHGAKWNDGDFYKWMEAASAMLATSPDPEWERILDEIIVVIGKAQRADGYIHTPVLIAARNGDAGAQPFADRFNFEMYNMGHLLTAACVHHQVTGRDNFLRIARRTGDFLHRTFTAPDTELARHAVCPSHYLGVIDLYRATGDARYLELAERFLEMRALVDGGGDDNQDRLPLAAQSEAAGHAVRANYLYAGAADLFAETGDATLWGPLERIWENMVHRKMYVTGGCGALYDGASPDGSADQGSITRVHQAYGRNYQLPNITAHNETCANIGNVLWSWRMFLASGEARFLDVAELALYNSVLSGVGLNGTDFFYVNPLRQVDTLPVPLRWSRLRVPFVTSFCCPPNVVRTIAESSAYAYARSNDGIWVNLYGSNSLATTLEDGGAVSLRQESEYPWDGSVRLTIEQAPDAPFALRLRIPGWTPQAAISLNGETQDMAAEPGTHATLHRAWHPGDTVELELVMPAQLVESHPLVEENRNQVAVKRGPVVYCLESHELPGNVRLSDVRIPADILLEARYDASLLDGVAVVTGKVSAPDEPEDGWEGRLYRPFQPRHHSLRNVSFIPYFAWANRGSSEMSVWLPLEASSRGAGN